MYHPLPNMYAPATNWGYTSTTGETPDDNVFLNGELVFATLSDADLDLFDNMASQITGITALGSFLSSASAYQGAARRVRIQWIEQLVAVMPKYDPNTLPENYPLKWAPLAFYIISSRCNYWRQRAADAHSTANIEDIIIDPHSDLIRSRRWSSDDFERRYTALTQHPLGVEPAGQVAHALDTLVRIAALVLESSNLPVFLREYNTWVTTQSS